MTTVSPPLVTLLLLESRAWTVSTSVLEPSEGRLAVAGLRVELAATELPAVKVTTQEAAPTEVPTAVRPMVAVTVAVPVVAGEVRVVV
jgi:hypothetical protein